MKKVSRSSPSISRNGQDDSSVEDYEDTLLDSSELDVLSQRQLASTPLNASTPCLIESRPSSTVGYDWDENWTPGMANSDSCLVSSSSGASPLTGTSSQGVSPDGTSTSRMFSFQNEANKIPDRSLSCISDALQTEKDFMEYVMSFPLNGTDTNQSYSNVDYKKHSTDSSPKVGLDHLDNLCKLMEQLSDLKDTNVKLKRRVQYLEDLKTLNEIHREMIGSNVKYLSGVSEDELQVKQVKVSPSRGRSKERSPDTRKGSKNDGFVSGLYRSKTTTHVDVRTEPKRDFGHRSRNDGKGKARERSKSVGHPGIPKCKKRSSRWSKVKEVFGIEKTDSAASCDRDGDSKTIDDEEELPYDNYSKSESKRTTYKDGSGLSRASNSHSKNDINQDKNSGATKSHAKASKTETHMDQLEQSYKKSPKTPWGRMKTMIQIRKDCRSPKSEGNGSSSRGVQLLKDNVDDQSQCGNRRISKSRKSSFTLQDVPKRHQHEAHNNSSIVTTNPQSVNKSPSRQASRRESESDSRANRHLNANTRSRQDKTPEKHSKSSDSRKDRPQLDLGDTTSSEKSKNRSAASIESKPSTVPKCNNNGGYTTTNPNIAKNFTNRVDDSPSIPPTPPSATATVTELLRELQENLSEDFNRKLEEWQKYRGDPSKASLDVERKESFGRFRKFSKPDKKSVQTDKKDKNTTPEKTNAQKKDLNWLDKEIPKVEREILRLTKEKQKFEKRAFRLKHLKDTMTEFQNTNEVLVRTSAGEFRFEGISNAFTKKLYEWETKKGVGPELSTIALLDESLKPKEPDHQSRECQSINDIDTRSMMPACDPSERLPYQKSSSEPDLSTLASTVQKETNGTLTTFRSKSGDTLLGNSSELSRSKVEIKNDEDFNEKSKSKTCESQTFMDRDDSYCTLLEENMFLLDQLKGKEEICARLQNELDRLDERSDKANKTHQNELENYKQKLWEIHMSRPRDLQGSLQLISELKTRIEELEKCSDKLKCDREKLEDSFKYHREQQSRLTDGLIRRILDMQESNFPDVFNRTGCKRKWKKLLKCDAVSVAKIHDLSTKLLTQAREMEEALAERTRQVCRLRWELLHRDMSAVLLQAALHRVTCQGPQAALIPTWNMKRIKFKELKAWSIDTTTRRQSENTIAEDWLQERLKQLSLAPYNEWTSIEFNPTDLMDTVHELKKETFRMSACRSGRISPVETRKKSCSAESENADSDRNYDTGSAFNSRSSSLSSGPGGGLRGSHSDTRLYERSRSLSVHRNSSSSMSCVSGFDASESSSIHESDRMHHPFLRRGSMSWNRKRRNRWSSKENVSSSCSSHSSGLEDDNVAQWDHEKEEAADYEDTLNCHLKYESLREADEENADYTEALPNDYSYTRYFPTNSETSTRTTEPTYSLLKSLISHPSYSRTVTSCSFATEPTTSNLDYKPGTEPGGPLNYNSSTYTSAESLESCHYVSHKEQQLFLDIRNLAISCEQDVASSSMMVLEKDSHDEDGRHSTDEDKPNLAIRPLTPECKLSTISQLKYKGTKGFGKTSRIDFKKYEDEMNHVTFSASEPNKDSDKNLPLV